ncbi:MAG: efflux transporter, RND family, MFP subunit [uncultured bacterium]|nr:MAG: efflux transporter, RND family, MFP subunit [uncultured bacterium]
MRDRRVSIFVAAVIAGAMLLAIFGPSATNRITNSRNTSAPDSIATGQSGGEVSAKGTVESSEEVVLSSQITGVVAKVWVSAGDTVENDQLLLEFDTHKIEAQRLQAKASVSVAAARLADLNAGSRAEDIAMAQHTRDRFAATYHEAKDEYESLSRLLAKDAVTAIEVSRAKEKLKIAEAQLKEADAGLKKYRSGTRIDEIRQAGAAYDRAAADEKYIESLAMDYKIHSPITGVIAERYRDKGESVDIETPLFKVINPSLTRIRAELEESEVGKVSLDQRAEVFVDAYPGKIFNGVVVKVFPVVQKKTQKSFDPMASFDINTQEIHIKLHDTSSLKNGMTVTVRFK